MRLLPMAPLSKPQFFPVTPLRGLKTSSFLMSLLFCSA
ncbi:hypothetical protein AZE42_13654 [Rhizopogon vesiculosus]|uniref:Uncharacterized protein n=1 Tax=Rhizopogon vesiculosus TaxID=180088 RepID=A0A1J8R6A3_9AGAM|nr:hypothetical protein AZE42_13654 [Rhizopogon vesiculosus]